MSSINKQLPDIPLDYTTNDYNGYFELMKNAIPNFTPDWTDTSDSDQGIVILQVLAYGLHVLGYYQERVMQENILELARTKRGILTGCNFLGYNPTRQTASVVELTIKKDTDFTYHTKVVPKGAQFSTNPQLGTPIVFETTEELMLEPGVMEGKVNAVQGITFEGEVIGVGNGNPQQRYTISNPDVLIDSLNIYTYEGNTLRQWTLVDNFLDSSFSDRHYTVSLDEEDRTIVNFGDGIFGMKPSAGININATYRMGGGVIGNLAPNLISYIYDTDNDLNFIDSVYNEEFAQGGSDYEDLERARVLAPKYYRSRQQAVSPTDFEDLAVLTPGVSKAKCVETFTSTRVYLYLLGDDYNAPNEALCQVVKEKVDADRVGNVDLIVEPCTITEFDIKCTIYVHDKFDPEVVKEQVKKNLEEYFHVSNFDFEGEFYANKVIDVAFNTAGVKNVVLDEEVTIDRKCSNIEILKLRNVTVEVGGGV